MQLVSTIQYVRCFLPTQKVPLIRTFQEASFKQIQSGLLFAMAEHRHPVGYPKLFFFVSHGFSFLVLSDVMENG
jgi:hypothetical protein